MQDLVKNKLFHPNEPFQLKNRRDTLRYDGNRNTADFSAAYLAVLLSFADPFLFYKLVNRHC